MIADPMERLAGKLACPTCGAALLVPGGSALVCRSCASSFPVTGPMVDLACDDGARSRTLSQKVMEMPAVASVYEKFWRPLVTRPFSDLAWERETAVELLDAREGDDILDPACGTGNFSRLVALSNPRCFFAGADISLPMLRRAARYLSRDGVENVALVRTDAGRWPFRPGSFSRVLCAGAFHLFPDPGAVARSVFETLAPGGLFVCATYLWGTKAGIVRAQKRIARNSGFHWFTLGELEGMLSGAGFTGFEYRIKKMGIVARGMRER